jgi:hypothetical protein
MIEQIKAFAVSHKDEIVKKAIILGGAVVGLIVTSVAVKLTSPSTEVVSDVEPESQEPVDPEIQA